MTTFGDIQTVLVLSDMPLYHYYDYREVNHSPDKRPSKTLLTMDERGSKIA